jgi:hypothetical protein
MLRFIFEDYAIDEECGDWTYVCEECKNREGYHTLPRGEAVPEGAVCGSYDCTNTAEYVFMLGGHEFGIEESGEFPYDLFITYGGVKIIDVRRWAWSTSDTRRFLRGRPENVAQHRLLKTLVDSANAYLKGDE